MKHRVILGALCVLALAACDDMETQPKQKVYSPLVGPAAVPAATVEYDRRAMPAPVVTEELLERGQERYRIYCTPCHSETGDGHGMIVQRGFPAPAPFDRGIGPPPHLYDVITQGQGAMVSFADRVQPADRWAIAAYVYALALSRHASVTDLSPDAREGLR